jgi:hypothetical protein
VESALLHGPRWLLRLEARRSLLLLGNVPASKDYKALETLTSPSVNLSSVMDGAVDSPKLVDEKPVLLEKRWRFLTCCVAPS